MSIRIPRRELSSNKSVSSAISPADVSISGFSVLGTDDLALDPAGGQTVVIRGKGFRTGATVQVGSNVISVVTVIDSTTLQFSSEALPSGLYNLYVINPNNSVAILAPGLPYSGNPVFVTESGSLGNYYETATVSETIEATEGNDTIRYEVTSGALPAGTTLFANGLITGTAPIENSSNTYSFTIAATDEENQSTTRSFSLTVNRDVVTWSAPSDGQQYIIEPNTAISNISLSASAASGNQVSYSANSLPVGITLSGDVIHGTPDANAETSITVLTATAANTNRSATRTINWSVQISDIFFNQTTLLLNGDDNTFITDASDNAFTITPNGDTRPSAFSPYNTNWSNYFDGNGDYLSFGDNLDIVANDFTFECFVYFSSINNTYNAIFSKYGISYSYQFLWDAPNNRWFWNVNNGASTTVYFSDTIIANQWYYLCLERTGTSYKLYRDGSQIGTTQTISGNIADGTRPFVIGYTFGGSDNALYPLNGYVSNFRAVIGSNVYGSAPSTPTTPLTAISGTSLLTCQSNRFVDNSTNNFTITKNGDTKVMSFGPFSADYRPSPDSYSVYFDGSGDYLTTPSNAAFGFGTGDFTIEGWWLFTGTISTYQRPWGFGDDNDNIEINGSVLKVGGGSQGTLITGTTTILPSTWYHIALVRSSGTYKLYLNGRQEGSSASNSYNSSARQFGIMAYTNGANPSTGCVSNLRIVKGTAVYTSNFVPSTAPLTTTSQGVTASNVSLLTCQDSTLTDNSSNGHTITSNGQAHPVTANPFDGSPITYSGYFDGSGDYLLISQSIDPTDFTFEMWVYPTTVSGPIAFFGAPNYELYLASGSLSFVNNGQAYNYTSSLAPLLNQWNHLGVTRSGSSWYIFLNGVVQTSGGGGTWNNTSSLGPGGSFIIGGSYYSSTLRNAMTGYISNFKYDNAHNPTYASSYTVPTSPLSAGANTQFLTCQSPGFIDNSSNAFAITVNGNTVVKPNNPLGYNEITQTAITDTTGSGYFDGSGDHLQAASNAAFDVGTGNFTMEFWVYPLAHSATYIFRGSSNSSWGGIQWYLYVDSNGTMTLAGSNGGGVFNYWSGGTTPLATWTHVAIVRDSNVANTWRVFVNGTSISYAVGAGASNTMEVNTTSQPLNIGGFPGWSQTTGYISDFRFVKGTAVYTSNFTPPTAPVTAITNTSLLTLQNCIGYNNSQPIDESGIKNVITRNGNASAGTFSPHVPTGWSGYFDGSDYLGVASFPAFGTGDFTVEWWAYKNDTWSDAYDITDGGSGAFAIYTNSAGNIYVTRQSVSGAAKLMGNLSSLNPNQWYYFAIVRQSGNVRCYVDGQPLDAAVADTNSYGAPSKLFGTADGYWPGYISNFRVFSSAIYDISSSSITVPTEPFGPTAADGTAASLLLLRSPTFNDESPSRLAITRYNDSKITPFSPFAPHTRNPDSHSVYFDGTGDYLSGTLPNAIGTDDFTFEAWVYNTTHTGGNESIFGIGVNNTSYSFYVQFYHPYVRVWADGLAASFIQYSGIALGQWYHIAVTRASNTLRLFVNGTLRASATTSNNFTDTYFRIGQIPSTSTIASTTQDLWDGYISNLRLVKGTALYTSSFTVPTEALTAVSNTALLACQSSTIIDNSTNNIALTAYNQSQPTQFNPFGETVTTGVEYSPVSHGGSVYFDGTGDFLSSPTSDAWKFGTGNFTIEFWYYYMDDNTGCLVGLDTASNGNWAIVLYSGMMYVQSGHATTSIISAISFANRINSWTHVVWTRNGSSNKLFFDGVLVNSATNAQDYNGTGTLVVGGASTVTTYGASKGYISNLRITKGQSLYDNAFVPPSAPPTPIPGSTLLINGTNAAIQDKTGRNVLETVGNARVLNGVKKYGSGAMYFDGTGDWLLVPSSPQFAMGTGNWTVECWAYPSSASTRGLFQITTGHLNSVTTGIGVGVSSTAGNPWRVYHGTTATDTGTNITTGAWQHIAFVRNGSTVTLYLDGTSIYSATDSSDLNSYTFLTIGAWYSSSFPWIGYIDDLRITKGVARYTGNFTPPNVGAFLK